MSFTQSSEISVIAEDPLFLTTRTFFERLTNQVSSYRHEIRRVGGFWSAGLRIADRLARVEDWVERGLGRHIEVYSPSLVLIWAGFVNQITASLGGTVYQVGPLLRVKNRIDVAYSTADHSTLPPTLGARVTTNLANNTASQNLHGIIQRRVGINAATQTQAEQVRDLFVNDPQRAFPQKSRDSDLSGTGGPSISLDCLGYWHWTGAYYYSQASQGEDDLSNVIDAVVNADPNSIVSSNLPDGFNTFQVPVGYKGNETADVILKRLISYGDVSNNPYNGGFYKDQELVYEAIDNEIEYELKLQNNIGVADKLGALEKPWNILPGRWVFDPYLLVGRAIPVTAEEFGLDPRATLIESVRFDAPWGLSINGVKLSQLDQVMARRGLGGIA